MSIYTEDLTKIYGTTRALDGVSISVDQGAILGVVGASGSGKSTLVRTIALLERPTRGRVVLDGQDLTSLNERELRSARRRLGNVSQAANLLDNRTVRANIEYPLEIAGWDRKKRWYRSHELLELVGLAGRGEDYPAQLSGGQRQRVGIARALAAQPTVILADEPTSALDPTTTQEILSLLTNLRDELNVTILLITHDLSIVRQIADRAAVLSAGRVVAQGTLAEVAADPQSGLLPELGTPVPSTSESSPMRRSRRNTGRSTNCPTVPRSASPTTDRIRLVRWRCSKQRASCGCPRTVRSMSRRSPTRGTFGSSRPHRICKPRPCPTWTWRS